MGRRAARAAILPACLGLCTAAGAAEPGFYVGADVGFATPTVDGSDGRNFGTPDGIVRVLPDSVRFDDSGSGWGGFVGYRIHRYLAAELAYLDFSPIRVEETFDVDLGPPAPIGPQAVTVDFDVRVSGPMASVMGILPLGERVEAFGRAGVLWADREVEVGPGFSLHDAEAAWALGLGLQAELGSGWSARLEYQRFDDLQRSDFSGEVRPERVLLGATHGVGGGPRARSRAQTQAAAGPGFYVVADLGVTEPAVGKSDGFLIAFTNFPGILIQLRPTEATADGADAGAGAALGYRINRYLAAELGYTDFGEADIRENYRFGPTGFPFFLPLIEIDVDVSSRVAGPSLNLLGILPLGEQFEAFARAGMLFADQELTRVPGHVTAANSEELWVLGVGIDVALARRWKLRFAYESVDGLRRTRYTGPINLERYAFGLRYDF